MDEVATFLAQRLGTHALESHREVHTPAGNIDLILHTPQGDYLVELTSRPADWNALARLEWYVHHPRLLQSTPLEGRPRAVLAAPGFRPGVREWAQESGVLLVELPLELLPRAEQGTAVLTTPKAWSVVVELLRRGYNPGVRSLAEAAGASTGWTSTVLRSLQAKGILDQRREPVEDHVRRLLDQVAAERPLKRLERARFSTGQSSWEDFWTVVGSRWNRISNNLQPPGLWLCGLSAAMSYTDYILRHDRVQVYAHDPAGLARLFEGRKGGIELVVHEPDRPVGQDAVAHDGWLDVSHVQALLDVAGMGFAARDTAVKLVEALRA